jgi:hypothetical protein
MEFLAGSFDSVETQINAMKYFQIFGAFAAVILINHECLFAEIPMYEYAADRANQASSVVIVCPYEAVFAKVNDQYYKLTLRVTVVGVLKGNLKFGEKVCIEKLVESNSNSPGLGSLLFGIMSLDSGGKASVEDGELPEYSIELHNYLLKKLGK